MANKYAVVSGLWSDTATWSDTDGGGGGATVPADDDAVFISAGVAVQMDADQSGFTGLRTVTIRGAAGTPGMLYFKDGTSGYLKIRTTYNLVGTSGANKGRLLANSNGTWGATGALAFADKAVIDLGATSKIDAQYLDIALYCTQPTYGYVETYKTAYTCTTQSTDVNTATDVITFTSAPPTEGTAVIVRSSSSLPGGLTTTDIYYTRTVSGNTCKLALQNSDATIVDITSTGSGTLTMYDGHTNTGTAVMNVIQDVTGDARWVTTAGHDRVVLADIGPDNYDQQRVTLDTIASGAITLSANVDSAQYPGARISLVARNVSIRSACVSAVSIVDYASATSSGGVFQCEIWSSAGTGTTFYGYAFNAGTSHTISGTISGCTTGTNGGTSHTISGTISGCNTGVTSGTSHTVSATVIGCSTGINAGTSHTISGTISGCTTGTDAGTAHTLSGTMTGCATGVSAGISHVISGTISGCNAGINAGTSHTLSGTMTGCATGVASGTLHTLGGTISGCTTAINTATSYLIGAAITRCVTTFTHPLIDVICRGGAVLPNPPVFGSRNTVAGRSIRGVFCEDYQNTIGASYAFQLVGDVIKQASTVRVGGAASALEVVPLSNCGATGWIRIFEWTECDVPASAQTRTVYAIGSGWSAVPTGDSTGTAGDGQLYLEAEYISNATTLVTSKKYSEQDINNSTWTGLSVTFTPAAAGHVRYRMWLGKYEAACKVFVDAQLN